MESQELISIVEFCSSHEIELSFISSLQNYGLIEVQEVEQGRFIPAVELIRLERLVRLHFDLNINLEGIDVILHLLNRVEDMQSEIRSLESRLKLYDAAE